MADGYRFSDIACEALDYLLAVADNLPAEFLARYAVYKRDDEIIRIRSMAPLVRDASVAADVLMGFEHGAGGGYDLRFLKRGSEQVTDPAAAEQFVGDLALFLVACLERRGDIPPESPTEDG